MFDTYFAQKSMCKHPMGRPLSIRLISITNLPLIKNGGDSWFFGNEKVNDKWSI